MQLFKLRSIDFPKLKEWLKKKTEKYTSHDIQNELLMLMAHNIFRDLTDEMRDSFYATICDEYTDISNKEQLTLCLRWVYEIFNIHEDFLGFNCEDFSYVLTQRTVFSFDINPFYILNIAAYIGASLTQL